MESGTPMEDSMKFANINDFVKIKGPQAASLKKQFVREVVEKHPEGGYERARSLEKADDYAILFELYDGRLNFRVKIGSVGEAYVGFGPDLVQRFLTDSIPIFNMGMSKMAHSEYAGAY